MSLISRVRSGLGAFLVEVEVVVVYNVGIIGYFGR